jgi:hypothetical protein
LVPAEAQKLFQGIHALPDTPQRHIELEAALLDVGSCGCGGVSR